MRGSTPCGCHENQGYGSNTACVVLEGEGFDPIILDLGTGVRYYGFENGPAFTGTALVTHLHWDHIQGLPFFSPLHNAGSSLEIVGPAQGAMSLEESIDSFLGPPYFPVALGDLAGAFTFREMLNGTIERGNARITATPVPHIGLTLGFRVEANGRSVAYVSDHQQPGCASTLVSPAVLELCRGVDVLIHDAQYTNSEFIEKFDWGHCTIDYAIEVAAQCEVGQLVLFHHDPTHGDDQLDELAEMARSSASSRPIGSVVAASEGMTISL